MKLKTKWRYYVPTMGDTAADAATLYIWDHQKINDAEDAAFLAADDDWNNDGHKAGIDSSLIIAVIDPDGKESRWRITHEATVEHYAVPVDEAALEARG